MKIRFYTEKQSMKYVLLSAMLAFSISCTKQIEDFAGSAERPVDGPALEIPLTEPISISAGSAVVSSDKLQGQIRLSAAQISESNNLGAAVKITPAAVVTK